VLLRETTHLYEAEPEGSFEEQIAELEAKLYTAESDQRDVILDALRQLRQRQHGPEQ
jgi:hypothetical protein